MSSYKILGDIGNVDEERLVSFFLDASFKKKKMFENDYYLLVKGDDELLIKHYMDDFLFNYWFVAETDEDAINVAYFFRDFFEGHNLKYIIELHNTNEEEVFSIRSWN